LNTPRPAHATSDRTALIVCLVALGVAIAYPTARLFAVAAASWTWPAVLEGAGRQAVVNTLLMGFASVITSGLLGSVLAYAVTLFRFPGRSALAALAYLPFALPPLVGTLSFYYLIGPDLGLIPRAIHRYTPFDDFNFSGPIAILFIHTYSFSVYFYAMVSAALENIDTAQIEAARTLGAGRWMTFRRITLPMLMPALLGASLLTFMTSGASFSAPLFFGNDFPYLSVQIYNERTQFHEAEALTLSVVLTAISLLGIVLFRSWQRTATGGGKGTPRVIQSRRGRGIAAVLAWTGMLVLLAPHLNILLLSFADHRAWQTELAPTVFTLENYTYIFRDPSAFQPIRNSVWMSLVAAAGCFAVGMPAAYLMGRNRRGHLLVAFLIMIPWALPGTVTAMNLITAFNDPWLPLYNTVLILPLAYFIRYIPLWARMATAAVTRFDATLIEAARTLGAAPMHCFRRIVVPLMAPSLVAATALVFASCLGEFVATILLYTPSNLPIAIRINQEWRGSGVGSAFAYAVLLMIIVTATFAAARRFASRTI
jgi:iron(III) transport system permease protein